jgi:threonine dehydratase
MGVKGNIFMPTNTPAQQIKQVKIFGKEWVEVILTRDMHDDSFDAAQIYVKEHGGILVQPFDDLQVMEGQVTVGLEIFKVTDFRVDYLLFAIVGSGLAAGVSTVFKNLSQKTKLVGIEPLGSPSRKVSIDNGKVTPLEHVDGAAVKKAGP